MDRQEKSGNLKHTAENVLVLILCTFIATAIGLVLMFVYQPDRNSLGALGSVSMDVISMLVLLILVVSLAFENKEKSHATRLFLDLMLATMVALFLDFMTWTLDGTLGFGETNYIFVVSSLCMGSVLACIFVAYLNRYLQEMYGLESGKLLSKICIIVDIIAFVVTLTLALTRYAFDFVDGHYETGELYDIVTAIPVLTLVCMAVFTVVHVKTIGIHDIIAVVGYIGTMIAGALVEGEYSIGTTYVAVSMANVFIFIMLQNKIIDKVKQQKEVLSEQVSSQYEILSSMAGIYSYVDYVDLEEKKTQRFDKIDSPAVALDFDKDTHSALAGAMVKDIEDPEKFLEYTDLTTLPARMKDAKIISSEFRHKVDGWLRAQYIRIGDIDEEPLKKVIFAIRNIDEEKKNVEKWIIRSNTDELTRFLNRRAYEEDVKALEAGEISEDLVYVSIDVNGLKVINDSWGHEAGDELLVGAAACMKQCLGSSGNLYRMGGDEFVAIIYADESKLEKIKKDLAETTDKWTGKLVKELTMSCGYVRRDEASEMTIRQMARLADKKMYEEKRKYYQKLGVDRRGRSTVSEND